MPIELPPMFAAAFAAASSAVAATLEISDDPDTDFAEIAEAAFSAESGDPEAILRSADQPGARVRAVDGDAGPRDDSGHGQRTR